MTKWSAFEFVVIEDQLKAVYLSVYSDEIKIGGTWWTYSNILAKNSPYYSL